MTSYEWQLLVTGSVVALFIIWRTRELSKVKHEIAEKVEKAVAVAEAYRNHTHPNVDKRLAELELRMNLAFPQPQKAGPFRSSGTTQRAPAGVNNDPGSEWDD